VRRAERHGAGGVGVDASPIAIEAARRRARARVPGADLRFVRADAATVDAPGPFALAACVGSSHALGGLAPALAALAAAVRPGGHVLLGEGFWRREPSAAFLAALGGATRDELGDLRGLVAAGAAAGLRAVSLRVSSEDDWDRYEWTLVANGERYAAAHPDAPGVDALLAWVDRARERVLLPGGRETLGFALVLLRRPG
jgi:SAM-dependent methyltransferase